MKQTVTSHNNQIKHKLNRNDQSLNDMVTPTKFILKDVILCLCRPHVPYNELQKGRSYSSIGFETVCRKDLPLFCSLIGFDADISSLSRHSSCPNLNLQSIQPVPIPSLLPSRPDTMMIPWRQGKMHMVILELAF